MSDEVENYDNNFATGDMVFHRIYGMGKVVKEWGVFTACRECFAPGTVIASEGPGPKGEAKLMAKCQCGSESCMVVSGRGIYDVLFEGDGKSRAINQCWLSKRLRRAA